MTVPDLHSILATTAHRPYPLPRGLWRLSQRWNDLLFAHWPVSAAEIQRLLPPGLEVDTFDGSAWVGVIPFWMDQVVTRSFGEHTFGVPTTASFAELNLRVYVRSRVSGLAGVFFFSLDCASPLAVFGARTIFHLPYFPAAMSRVKPGGQSGNQTGDQTKNQPGGQTCGQTGGNTRYQPGEQTCGQTSFSLGGQPCGQPDPLSGGQTEYRSRRQLARLPARYDATYGPVPGAQLLPQSKPGSFAYFVSERYCLFTPFAGRMLVGHIHHLPWPLEPAQAEIRVNEIAMSSGITLPATPPVLHFARQIRVLLWALRPDRRD